MLNREQLVEIEEQVCGMLRHRLVVNLSGLSNGDLRGMLDVVDGEFVDLTYTTTISREELLEELGPDVVECFELNGGGEG